MRVFITLLIISCTFCMSAQNFSYPDMRQHASSISDFIPQGWTILDSASGDLNRDQRQDHAFVLELNKAVVLKFSKKPDDTLTTKPRMLVILFSDPSEGYDLAERHN